MINRFHTRLLLSFLPLFLVVQALILLLIYNAARDHITVQSNEALIATSRNFHQWLDDTAARLATSSLILTADFGFRSALASADLPIIRSALHNAIERIDDAD